MNTVLTQKKNYFSKKVFSMILLCFVFLTMSFAQSKNSPGQKETLNGIGMMKDIFMTVYTWFTGPYVKIICLAGLIWIGIQMITNRGDQQFIKRLLPWAGAAILIGGASWFCDKFLGGSISTEVNQLGGSSWL